MDWVEIAKLTSIVLPGIIKTVEALHPATPEVPRKGELKKAIVVGLIHNLFSMASVNVNAEAIGHEVDKTVQDLKSKGEL